MMDRREQILWALLRKGLQIGTDVPATLFSGDPDWKWIYKMAARQGILAIVYDGLAVLIDAGVIPADKQPERALKLQWGFNVVKIEQRFEQQKRVAVELADIYAEHNIRTVVLKGLAAAQYYPVQNHRPCGDLDCFLMGEYERGNQICEQIKADVKRDYYKHSHIVYKGLIIENHQFCTAIRGSKRAKNFERELQKLLPAGQTTLIGDSHLEAPDPLFDALFLTIHAWGHFLTEGIALRHLVDWMMLLDKHEQDIDWTKFKVIAAARDRGMLRFAESMIALAHFVADPSQVLSDADSHLLQSILYDQDKINNKGYSAWMGRVMLVKNALCSDWKYKAYSEQSSFGRTINNIWSFIFERNPHL